MHYSKAVDGPRRFFLTALLAVGCSAIAVGSAVAGVKPADPKPFIGEWAIAFPEGAGVIVNKPDTTCDAPAIISAGPDGMISIRTPKGDAGNWAVKSFGGRNPLWRDDGVDQTLVADWIDGDRFLLAGKDASGIKTDWTRCK
jgi:hypothetical protein